MPPSRCTSGPGPTSSASSPVSSWSRRTGRAPRAGCATPGTGARSTPSLPRATGPAGSTAASPSAPDSGDRAGRHHAAPGRASGARRLGPERGTAFDERENGAGGQAGDLGHDVLALAEGTVQHLHGEAVRGGLGGRAERLRGNRVAFAQRTDAAVEHLVERAPGLL